MDEYPVQGMQLTVSVGGNTVLSEGFGYSNIQNMIPVTTETRFRVGSVSKALTSAALIKLASENKLDMDAPIRNYVPSYPKKQYSFTTRQLAGHLAGIRHYNGNDLSDLIRADHFNSATESVTIFMNDSLLFKPGTQYHYSSVGWNLIGAVIEGASKVNYLDYMFDNVWKPLGMMQTYGDVADFHEYINTLEYDDKSIELIRTIDYQSLADETKRSGGELNVSINRTF
jgi:CubicO group peptidase (beta-lactamase class C family)